MAAPRFSDGLAGRFARDGSFFGVERRRDVVAARMASRQLTAAVSVRMEYEAHRDAVVLARINADIAAVQREAQLDARQAQAAAAKRLVRASAAAATALAAPWRGTLTRALGLIPKLREARAVTRLQRWVEGLRGVWLARLLFACAADAHRRKAGAFRRMAARWRAGGILRQERLAAALAVQQCRQSERLMKRLFAIDCPYHIRSAAGRQCAAALVISAQARRIAAVRRVREIRAALAARELNRAAKCIQRCYVEWLARHKARWLERVGVVGRRRYAAFVDSFRAKTQVPKRHWTIMHDTFRVQTPIQTTRSHAADQALETAAEAAAHAAAAARAAQLAVKHAINFERNFWERRRRMDRIGRDERERAGRDRAARRAAAELAAVRREQRRSTLAAVARHARLSLTTSLDALATDALNPAAAPAAAPAAQTPGGTWRRVSGKAAAREKLRRLREDARLALLDDRRAAAAASDEAIDAAHERSRDERSY
ncbi:hypothetical protein M885DRAFT_560410 [Pelagophyceae sp. CCMP2097]|nr:hypothetical protein M885DRAFT_560410 [Pelagophyceae sp. CCMP2097]